MQLFRFNKYREIQLSGHFVSLTYISSILLEHKNLNLRKLTASVLRMTNIHSSW